MDNVEWVAGLLEGEGTFYTQTNGYSPRIACNMTDLDVLEKLKDSVGCGSLVPVRKRQSHWKDAWIWRASGDQAADVMKEILPFMGQRRRGRIEEVLSLWYTKGKSHRGASENMRQAVDYYLSNQVGLREVARKFKVGKDTLNKYSKLRRVEDK